MTRLEWLKARQSGIGASDAPIVVGVGFESADWLYRQKTTPPPEAEPETGPLARGTRLEPIVAETYERKMGCTLVPAQKMIRHPDRPWQFVNPDFVRIEPHGRRDVDMKAIAYFDDEWGDEGSDQIPDKYRVQAQHAMGVQGLESMDFGVLAVVPWELRVYRVAFDHEFFEEFLTPAEALFMGCVRQQCPPGPDWSDSFRAAADRRLATPGKRVELGEGAAELLRRWNEFRDIEEDAAEAALDIKAQLEALMGDAEEATAPGFKLKWQTRKAHTRPACEVKESRSLSIRSAKT